MLEIKVQIHYSWIVSEIWYNWRDIRRLSFSFLSYLGLFVGSFRVPHLHCDSTSNAIKRELKHWSLHVSGKFVVFIWSAGATITYVRLSSQPSYLGSLSGNTHHCSLGICSWQQLVWVTKEKKTLERWKYNLECSIQIRMLIWNAVWRFYD